MGRLEHGILGITKGSVGSVIVSSWKGKPYIKSRYTKRTNKRSKKEIQNHSKFAMAHYWLKPLIKFIRVGFSNYNQSSGEFNAAKSHLLKHAFEGTAPDIYINPALVKLSIGDLPLSPDIAIENTGGGILKFTWDANALDHKYSCDQVMLLAYSIDRKTENLKTTGQLRSTGSDTLLLHTGVKYDVYVAFNAADRSTQSDSVYLGEITM